MYSSLNQLSMNELIQKYRDDRAIKDKAAGIISNESDGKGHAMGYTRVSTQMQAKEGKSIESQRTAIENYCKLKNLILDDIIDEPAKSGADKTRPKLKALIESLKSGSKLICYSIDRICRDVKYLLEIKDTLHLKNCSMYFIDRSLDTSDTSTELLLTIMGAVAAENRKSQNRTISNVMQDMSEKGILRTRPKYGWKIVDHAVVPADDEQAVIEIIRLIIKDNPTISLTEISRKLEAIDIKIRKSKKIYPTTIKNIIDNNNLRPNQNK
jgi:site-specific DNA recombinase